MVLTADQTRFNSTLAHSNIAQVPIDVEESGLGALIVRVVSVIRSAALRALSAGVPNITAPKKVGAAESELLFSLLPIVVKLCGVADADLRALGLLLSNRLSTLTGALTIEAHFAKHLAAGATDNAIQAVTSVVADRSVLRPC